MSDKEINEERRDHRRHKVTGLVVAVPKSSNQVCRVINVSMGGLAVRYVNEDGLDESTEIDILADNDFYLTNLPITVVSNFEVKSKIPLSVVPERQIGAKYGKLTAGHESMLRLFIDNHTTSGTHDYP